MSVETMSRTDAVEQFLIGVGLPHFSISRRGKRFEAVTYWPSGDVLRDAQCWGQGSTLAEAFEEMMAEIEKAKLKGKTLKTAAECKDAVIQLIREHDAAPASFRDAVDALPVAK